ncbi:cell envelope integrity protein TolA [Serratia symbiotica]|uniref:cell envelope integrity protein TolA n=1 Tax=Serratia symbiotica TaxID=138074 RepID=UPI001E189640|nr:cell envelope integrity protein TolA [Serratia symbiotica]NIG87652.1 cell envelope integrity protein TolA [Serratia symbiotica]USS96702.1 cell envelope integrity protein TolA [Serratia symbiotica]
MVKATEQNDKLNRAVIVSVVLHLILIALLIWGSLQENIMSACGGDGSVVGAVMVDPNAVVEQYNRQQQSNDAQRAEKLRQKKAPQLAEELQQKQAAEQQRLKALEKERLAMQEKTAQQAKMLAEQQKAAAEAKEQQKVAEVAAAKAKAQADKLALAQAEAQKKAEARKQAEEAKNAAEQKAAALAKKKAAAAKQSAEVDDLFNGLSDGKNAPEGGGKQKGDGQPAGHNAKAAGASGADINGYMGQIQGAIQSKFYDPGSFTGKTCDLRIKLAQDGLLISVQEVGGDLALCQAAVSAAKLAQMPKPPSDAVYQHFKNFTLGFKPQ